MDRGEFSLGSLGLHILVLKKQHRLFKMDASFSRATLRKIARHLHRARGHGRNSNGKASMPERIHIWYGMHA
jgi:hypothetical protein